MIDAFRHVVHLCPADQRHVGRPMRNSWEVEGSQERERRLRHVFFGQTFSKTSDYFWWWTLKLKVIENFMFEREAHFESIKYVFLCICIYALNWHIYIYTYIYIYIFIFLYMNLKTHHYDGNHRGRQSCKRKWTTAVVWSRGLLGAGRCLKAVHTPWTSRILFFCFLNGGSRLG